MKIFILVAFMASCQALTLPNITGTTPSAIDCPNSLCYDRVDGNYEYYSSNGEHNKHYFIQCVDGSAHCQACWPLYLEFSEYCNQCLYGKYGDCVETKKSHPATTFECPDKCPHLGPHFSGNIADPNNSRQYISCWDGATVGCVACPKGLEFNKKWNACLFDGVHKTQPDDNKIDTTASTTKYY